MISEYDSEKWLYEHDLDDTVRYVLGIKGENPLVCFGVNPSTASPNNLDNTIKSVQRILSNTQYDSWIMLNLYPLRSTDPYGMPLVLDKELHQKNLSSIKETFSRYEKVSIWCAWGNLIEVRQFLYQNLRDIVQIANDFNCKWHSVGKVSKSGHPHHPLYLNSESPLDPFDINMYLSHIS